VAEDKLGIAIAFLRDRVLPISRGLRSLFHDARRETSFALDGRGGIPPYESSSGRVTAKSPRTSLSARNPIAPAE